MPFILTDISSSPDQMIELTTADSIRYAEQRRLIIQLIEIEKNYSVASLSFVEFERLMHEIALDQSVHSYDSGEIRQKASDVTDQLNLKMLNLLNAYSVYLEHTPRLLAQVCSSLPDLRLKFNRQTNQHFERSVHYRIMSGLRNVAQHYALPIKTFSFGGRRKRGPEHASGPQSHHRNTIDPYIEVSELLKSKKLKGAKRETVESLGKGKIDVKMCVRGYVEQVSDIHIWLREETTTAIETASRTYDEMFERLTVANGKKKRTGILYEINSNPWRDSYIGFDQLELIDKKRSQWTKLRNISTKHISSQPVSSNDTFYTSDPTYWVDD